MWLLDIIHPDSRKHCNEIFKRVLSGEEARGIEAKFVSKDGKEIVVEGNASCRFEEGRLVNTRGIFRDITERKQVEDELREYSERLEEMVEERTLEIMMANERLQDEMAERNRIEQELRARNVELDAFARTISHDLRGSVSVIDGYAQAALEEGQDLTEECLRKIVRAADRMEVFIESLLAYSEAGRPEGKLTRLQPNEVLREVLEEKETEIGARNVNMLVDEMMPVVQVDPVRLHQVFANLLGNALKFLGDDPHPRVELGARREGDRVIFYVRDNGIGIPEADHQKIFEPFECLETEGPYGLGIGLSTVKRAVEGWGGEVWVESTPGEGSTFYFSVPAAEA